MEYCPKPILPLNPYNGIIFTTGIGNGADVQGCIPTNLVLGMKIPGGNRSGISAGVDNSDLNLVSELSASASCMDMNRFLTPV